MNKLTKKSVPGFKAVRKILNPRRVILLALDWSRDKDTRAPLGFCSILSSLKAAKRAVVSIIEPVQSVDIDAMCSLICSHVHEDRDTDLAIGVYCWNDQVVRQLLRQVRIHGFKGRIILGGPQISFMESGFKAVYPDADVFICGDGEEALERVTQSFEIIAFPGVHYGDMPGATVQARSDLFNLPSPWLHHDWHKVPLSNIRWETMRGCPYSCNFCQHRKKKPGVSYFAHSRLLAEIDLFCERQINSISVLDPVFNVNSDWAINILNSFIERRFKGRISLQCRAELITDNFLEAARKLNVTLEFGLQTIHTAEADAINRTNDIRRVDEALFKARRLNIKHEVSVIFGLPNQTVQSFLQTVEWCLSRDVPVIKAFPLMLLKGTELAESACRWNMQESATAIPWVCSSDTFTEHDWHIMNAISSYLHETEGAHPKSLPIQLTGKKKQTNSDRWSPHALNPVGRII